MAAIMQGLNPEAYDRQYSDKELINRILSYFRVYWRKFLVICVTLFIMSGLGAATPLLISNGVDVMAGGRTEAIPILIGVIFFIGTATWGVNWIRRQLTAELIADVIMNMRQDAFSAAAQQDLSFYDEFSSGRIVSRITSDTEEFGQIVILATDVIQQIFVSLILIITLFTIQWQLTLAVLVMAPFVTLAALGFRRVARRITRQSARALGEVNKSIQEAVTGISIAKNYRQEYAIYSEFKEVNDQSYDINVRQGFILANIFPTLNVLAGFGTALLVYVGGRTAVAGIISVAAWYLFVATVDRFWFPVMNLSAFWSQFQQGLSAAERVFALVDAEPRVIQTDNRPVPPLQGHIQFSNVDFQYTAKEKILTDFSLDIPTGQSIALVGHTGAGKSSLIKIVSRFYEFQAGQLKLDGHDVRTFDLSQYRQQLGIVSQVPFLFDGTVADNIRYGRPDATDEEIMAMARRIGDGEWLETLPNGLDSAVGERGSRLSMGQRQLVALVRVLVQRPKIFLLDEATASIDPFTESQIQQALDLIMQDTTSIIIAHRLSTVRNVDQIIVLERGRIIEEGNHAQLIAADGHYADLYNTYFRHQSLDYIDQRGWEAERDAVAAD